MAAVPRMSAGEGARKSIILVVEALRNGLDDIALQFVQNNLVPVDAIAPPEMNSYVITDSKTSLCCQTSKIPILLFAVHLKRPIAVRGLVELGAKVDSTLNESRDTGVQVARSAVGQALAYNDMPMLRLLHSLGAKMDVARRVSWVANLPRRGSEFRELDTLVTADGKPAHLIFETMSALQISIAWGRTDAVKFLLSVAKVSLHMDCTYFADVTQCFVQLLLHGESTIDIFDAMLNHGWDFQALEVDLAEKVNNDGFLRYGTAEESWEPTLGEVLLDMALVSKNKVLARYLRKRMGITMRPGTMKNLGRADASGKSELSEEDLQIVSSSFGLDKPTSTPAQDRLKLFWPTADAATTRNAVRAEGYRDVEKMTCATCEVVGASKVCTRCKEARYCSEACQRLHWKTHKANCVPAPKSATKRTT